MTDSTAVLFYLLSYAMLAVAVVFLIFQHFSGQRNLLAPSSLFMAVYALQFGILNRPAVVFGEKLFPGLLGRGDLLIGTMAIALGTMILFGIGYGWMYTAVRKKRPEDFNEVTRFSGRIKLPMIFAFYLVGLTARFILLRMGLYSYLSTAVDISAGQLAYVQVLIKLERYCSFSLVALAIAWCMFPERLPYRLSLIGVLLLELFFNFLGGTKGLTLINFFYVGVVYWYIKGRMPPRRWLAAGALAWIIITPWNLSYRERIISGPTNTVSVGSALGTAGSSFSDAFLSPAESSPFSRFLENVESRIPMLQEATLVMQYADQVGRQHGKKYWLLLPSAFIPRFLWPDKPQFETGTWVTREIFGEELQSGSTSTSITAIGDFYLDFGVVGPLLGFLLWGFFFGWFEARFEKNVSGILLIGALYLALIRIGGDEVFWLVGGFVKETVVFIPFAWAAGFGMPWKTQKAGGT